MSLGLVPPGSTIKRVYYAVPDTYAIGQEYPDFITAVRAALALRDETTARVRASYPADWVGADEEAKRCGDVKCVVDLRWVIEYPPRNEFQRGDGLDTVIERKNVSHLSADHCDRMEALRDPQPSLG